MFSKNPNIITIEDVDIKIQAFEVWIGHIKDTEFLPAVQGLGLYFSALKSGKWQANELTLFLLLANHKYLPYAFAKLQYFLIHLNFQEDQMLLKIYY